MYKKIAAIIIVLVHCFVALNAQDCYNYTRSQGISFYNKGNYTAARLRFASAKECPDKPENHDLDMWIKKCDSALAEIKLAEERRRQEEERQRVENLLREQEKRAAEEKQYARIGYMNIDRIEFKYATKSSGGAKFPLNGSTVKSSDITYIYPYVYYDGLTSQNRKISYDVKILNPSEYLLHGKSSPDGYTYSGDTTVCPGHMNCMALPGYGSASGGSYMSGLYRAEIWYNGNKLYQQAFRVPGPAVKIKKIISEEGVYENGVKGIRIHVQFNVYGLNGKKASCGFYLNGHQMKDKYFYPSSDYEEYSDFHIFISNSEIYSSQYCNNNSNYFLIVVADNDITVVDMSDEYYFNLY